MQIKSAWASPVQFRSEGAFVPVRWRLHFLVDKIPSWDSVDFEERHGLYVGVKDGFVYHIYKSEASKADKGFAGSERTLRMKNGAISKFRGGWHVGSGKVSHAFPEYACIDAAFDTEARGCYSGAVLLNVARRAMEAHLPDWEIRQDEHGPYIAPKDFDESTDQRQPRIASNDASKS